MQDSNQSQAPTPCDACESRPPPTKFLSLVFSPAITACHALCSRQLSNLFAVKGGTYLVESRHRFIGTANLHLEEGGLVAVTAGGWALDVTLLRIVPCAGPAEDVFFFLAGEILAREYGRVNSMLIGASAALQSVPARVHTGKDQEVCAVWADLRSSLVKARSGNCRREGTTYKG